MKNSPTFIQDKAFENKLLKTKPKSLHEKKLKMVFAELERVRKENYEQANAFENESLKINFKPPREQSKTTTNLFWPFSLFQ